MNVARYSASERLRNGAEIEIRALVPGDRVEMLAAFDRTSPQTRYRRFFAPKNSFSEREIEFFLNVDFVNHVALAAVLNESGEETIVGGARYVLTQPGQAEVAFAIDDPHQKLGIATQLMKHLVAIARASELQTFVADVLPENLPMLRVFERCGLKMTTHRDRGVVRVTLDLLGGANT
ncbi:GNAT family N-acetyltransferase [Reyranella sp.]|uniref:GNAT family N-acetyltransferase n=1 Tax=Reyranella sp. TaxID=1929291 RepID=UPI0012234741|nr:GNAT family N-acetyltransferase [Reyranella sp.]TAJ89450.1 MAG: GNAT family N-acetyltransferase [Reyranella sp.]